MKFIARMFVSVSKGRTRILFRDFMTKRCQTPEVSLFLEVVMFFCVAHASLKSATVPKDPSLNIELGVWKDKEPAEAKLKGEKIPDTGDRFVELGRRGLFVFGKPVTCARADITGLLRMLKARNHVDEATLFVTDLSPVIQWKLASGGYGF